MAFPRILMADCDMANLRPGQRAKKVRGQHNIGLTGLVTEVGGSCIHGDAYTAKIIVDGHGVGYNLMGDHITFGPGECVWFQPADWEPMQDAFDPDLEAEDTAPYEEEEVEFL